MNFEQKYKILEGIARCVPENGAGEDEENLLQNFLPLRSYGKLADPKTFLITGGRGTGKTALFRMLTDCEGLKYILSEGDRKRYTHLKEARFVPGYAASGAWAKQFPISNLCTELLKKEGPEDLVCFWGGLACASVLTACAGDKEMEALAEEYFPGELQKTLRERASEVFRWWDAMKNGKQNWEGFLDQADNLLNRRQKTLFLTYDELDKLCMAYDDLFAYIRGLLNFWYVRNNRFTNLKAKIFLRSDLYNARALQFADASKMRGYQLELKWNIQSFYRVLVKRIANSGVPEAAAYLKETPGLLQERQEEGLGYIPGDSETALRGLVGRMIGKYMGRTPKKGSSYPWVANHIQDGNGEGAPRSFLKCFSIAARQMLDNQEDMKSLEGDKLLLPSRLQGALTEVSFDRCMELTREEYPWIANLMQRMRGKTMLMREEEFLLYLSPEFWNEEERKTLPGKTSGEILDALCSLGIVMRTADNRINFPEIYLHGFGLKRKGGIKRPKETMV